MNTRKKRPTDTNQLAKRIVDISTGGAEEIEESERVVSGRKGGLSGGNARADKLSKSERSEIAKKGTKARWNK